MIVPRFALLALAGLTAALIPAAASAAPRKPAPAHHAADWAHVAIATPDGGIRTGNPAAKVRLVEYFSFTCPHCAAFAGEAFPKIVQDYVRPGQMSFELRAALRDPIDLVVASAARAAKPGNYVTTVQAIMARQSDWLPKAIDYVGAHQADLNGPDKTKAIHAMLASVGVEAILVQQGIPAAAIEPALDDKAVQAALDKSTNDAWNVRKIGGTPGFLINDGLQQGVYGWPALEQKVQAAIKG